MDATHFQRPVSGAALILAAVLLFSWNGYSLPAQGGKHDSIQQLLGRTPDDTGKVVLLNDLSLGAWERSDYADALRFANEAHSLSRKLLTAAKDSAYAAWLKRSMARAHNNIGNVYDSYGNYAEALKQYFNALRIYEQLGHLKGISSTYNNIGNVYDASGNYEDALKNYNLSLDIKKKTGDKKGTASAYNNIGLVYYNLKDYSRALENIGAALNAYREIGHQAGMGAAYNNAGIVYSSLNNDAEALKNYFEAYRIREALGNRAGLAITSLNIGNTYSLLRDFAKARKYLDHALQLSEETGYTEGICQYYNAMTELDTLQGNFTAAFLHYKLYIAYRDSLVNEENTKKTVQAQMQYEFEKEQAADSVRNAEQMEQEALKHGQEIRQQKLYTFGGALGFVLMLAVAGVSYNAFRQKQKANAIISEQKQLAELKQKEILDSIHYAKRIQQSLLPSDRYISRALDRLNPKT
jgi:tetratricopeptide (TPR) repeat protein